MHSTFKQKLLYLNSYSVRLYYSPPPPLVLPAGEPRPRCLELTIDDNFAFKGNFHGNFIWLAL